MTVREHTDIQKHHLPGIEHQTLAGASDGLTGTEVWMQTLAAGAETPVHQHQCEEVVVVTRGAGTCRLGNEDVSFGANSTLIIPAGVEHKISNTGAEPIHLIAAFSATPAVALTADGQPIALPWSQPYA